MFYPFSPPPSCGANACCHVCFAGTKWEDIELLLRHGLEDCMRLSPQDNAIMLVRNAVINSVEDHEKALQVCFESLQSPAMHCMPGSSLSSFSVGRPTALVVDIGAAGTSITPVIEGYSVRRAAIQSAMGGQLLDHIIFHYLSDGKCTIKPWFDKTGASVPNSLRKLHIFDIVRDVKQWMCLVPPTSIANGGDPINHLPPPYELPDGTVLNSSYTLCTLPEQCYFPSCRLPSTNNFVQFYLDQQISTHGYLYYGSPQQCPVPPCAAGHSDLVPQGTRKRSRSLAEMPGEHTTPEHESLSDLIYCSLARADADYRKELASNIILAGGGSLLDGLAQRLNRELNEITPSHIKIKLSNNLGVEKQHSSWLGGSILSICGSFHQLWISRQEYEEQGEQRLARRLCQR